jgi:hypothetical protein
MEVVPGYNFLSLYGQDGRCELHMDEPISMFTLDYCIDQNVEWPIYFSKIVDWPQIDIMRNWQPDDIINDAAMEFSSRTLDPNNAVIFCGSSQWHYRDPIPQAGYCNLLFFHYYPKGAEGLVWPHNWPEHFDCPELQPFCDLIPERERAERR